MHAPLPAHPLTGTRALGWRKARPGEETGELHPIWPILGAADDADEEGPHDAGDSETDDRQDEETGGDDAPGQDTDPDGADQLGDKGKRALASMKGKWRTERDRRRELERKLASQEDGDDDAAAQAAQAAAEKANQRILKAEIRAAAKGRLADPKDALTFLDLGQFDVDEDGAIDEDEIAEAIGTLLTNKPYLAAQGGKRFQGTGDGGAARKAGRPKQLTRADLKSMTPAQILKAKEDGQLDDALGHTAG